VAVIYGSKPFKNAFAINRYGPDTACFSTPAEERRFRQAMRNLRDAFGTWGALAAAMGANEGTIDAMQQGRSRVSGELIIRAMRASGLTLGELLGDPALAGRCRACGQIKRAS
jgi:hypothetical protein